jgi:hypothetical protein
MGERSPRTTEVFMLRLFLVSLLILFLPACAHFGGKPAESLYGDLSNPAMPKGPGYLGPKEMMKLGENKWRIPETSFMFYPKGWVMGPIESWYKPCTDGRPISLNRPSWDNSCEDDPSIRHDCFVPVRLFVIPWGGGEVEVGVPKQGYFGDLKPGYKYLPKVEFCEGKIHVRDWINKRVLVFDYSGRVVERYEDEGKCRCESSLPEHRRVPTSKEALRVLYRDVQGTIFEVGGTYEPGGSLEMVDLKTYKTTCRIWFPGTRYVFFPFNDEIGEYRYCDDDFKACVTDRKDISDSNAGWIRNYHTYLDNDAHVFTIDAEPEGLTIYLYQPK